MKYTDQQKRMFYTSGYFNRWKLNFQELDLLIDNETIHTESPVVKESICENEDLVLGGCIASSFSFEVSEIIQYDLTGIEFMAQLETVSEDGVESLVTPMGRYRVDSAETLDDKDYKQITAYDALYDASDDATEWYQSFFADNRKHTVKETRVSLLQYFGIPVKDQTLINDDVLLEQTIDPNGALTGITVLRALCEINGGFGRMDRQGRFEVVQLHGLGVFPEDQMGEGKNIYPEDNPQREVLYPEDDFEYLGISDYVSDYPEWRSITAEDYTTLPISCLSIRDAEDGIGTTIGDDLSNPYVITGNLFLYGKSSEELSGLGTNILSCIKGITYRPNTTELNGLPYIETGDVYAMMRKSEPVESYVLSRTLKGIDALIDTYEAKGKEMRANEVSAGEEIIQLKGKTLTLKKSIDGVSMELENLDTKTSTRFEQTDTSIKTTAEKTLEESKEYTDDAKDDAIQSTDEKLKNYSTTTEMNSAIEQTANSITSSVDEKIIETKEYADGKMEEAVSISNTTITQTANSITQEVSETYETKSDAETAKQEFSSQIAQTAKEIVLKVDANGKIVSAELTADPKTGTEFKVGADNISLTAEQTINLLAGGTLNLSGKNIEIESDNFTVDSDGTVTATSINIEGGSVNLSTSDIGEGLIDLKNVSHDAGAAIDYYGYGAPDNRIGKAARKERKHIRYLDLDTGEVWDRYKRNGTSVELIWKKSTEEKANNITWQESIMSTSDGFKASQFNQRNISNSAISYVKDEKNITINGDSISFDLTRAVDYGTGVTESASGSIQAGMTSGSSKKVRLASDCQIMSEEFLVGSGNQYGKLSFEDEAINSDKNFHAPNIGSMLRKMSKTIYLESSVEDSEIASRSLESGVYIAIGSAAFSSNPTAGRKICRLSLDGSEISKSQIAVSGFCAIQCVAFIETDGGEVSIAVQQECGSTLTVDVSMQVLRIR